jgi:hypothetical protein
MMDLAIGLAFLVIVAEAGLIHWLLGRLSDIGLAQRTNEAEIARLVKECVNQSQVLCDKNGTIRYQQERIDGFKMMTERAIESANKARDNIDQVRLELDPPF